MISFGRQLIFQRDGHDATAVRNLLETHLYYSESNIYSFQPLTLIKRRRFGLILPFIPTKRKTGNTSLIPGR